LQDHLAHEATHDSLTGLPNRAQALELLQAALHRSQRNRTMVGLLFVDLDGFKAVNDTQGHQAGDDVLRTVARRLRDTVRAGDVVARLGGDEFVVLLEYSETDEDPFGTAGRLISAVSVPITLANGREARVGASIGVAFSEDDSVDADRLLHEADTAAYRAKAAGRGRVEIFDDVLRHQLAERASIEAALVEAIANDELVVHYQPIVDLRTGRTSSLEALVRWQRPGVGLVPPAEFIPEAESSSLICDLDTWVLHHVARQLAEWQDSVEDAPQLAIAVNISGRHVSNPRIMQDVRDVLDASGISPEQLILEITETVLIEDLAAIDHLESLRSIGVAVSIDDFGTGYNSIGRLRYLPIDIIKIDKSFLDDGDPASSQLFELIVRAAHAFGLPVVAEGVESHGQIQRLNDLNCESAQGYYFAPPRPWDATIADLNSDSTAPAARPASAGRAHRRAPRRAWAHRPSPELHEPRILSE